MIHFWQRALRILRDRRLPHFATHLANARHAFTQRPWRSFDMVSLVSLNPPVILTGCHPAKLATILQPRLARHALTIFYRAGWSLEDEATLVDRIAAIRAARRKFPQHRYIFAVNTPREIELVTAAGIQAELLHENAFVDEHAFCPGPEAGCTFDAVLDAQIAPYKRLELAAGVGRLVVITYLYKGRFNPEYGERVRGALAHAVWANGPYWDKRYRPLSRPEVAATYRQAKVGLCLSPVEGGNLASIQYLLAGLAVVSTASVGGRDAFFDPAYAAVVPAEPPAIAAAVEQFVRQRPPAASIRECTLLRMGVFRRHFADLLVRECGHPPVDEAWWREFNSRRPIAWQDLRQVAGALAAVNRPLST